jgi:hypothetical protein
MASPRRDNSHNHLSITADYIYNMKRVDCFKWLAYVLVRQPVARQTRTSALHSSWNSFKQALKLSYPRRSRQGCLSARVPRTYNILVQTKYWIPASAEMTNAVYCLANDISNCSVRSCPTGCDLTKISRQVTLHYNLPEHEFPRAVRNPFLTARAYCQERLNKGLCPPGSTGTII